MNIRVYTPTIAQMLLIAGILVFAIGIYFVLTFNSSAQVRPLPNLILEDGNGNPVALHEFTRGRVAVINAWASWCPSCTTELPDFSLFQKEYGADVAVIAINRKESAAQAKAYLAEHGINGGLTVLFDDHDAFYRAINGVSMPETIIVNTEGNIVFHKRGPMTITEMRTQVAALTE